MKKLQLILVFSFICLALLVGCNNTEKDNETPISDFEFESGDGGMIVTKYKGRDKSVVIPAVVENKKVTSLRSNVFSGNIILEEIVLPEHMATLDISNFSGCDNLKTITCKGNITKIVIGQLSNLETLNLPYTEKIALNTIGKLTNQNSKLVNFDLSSITEFGIIVSSNRRVEDPGEDADECIYDNFLELSKYKLPDGLNITLSETKYKEIEGIELYNRFEAKQLHDIGENTDFDLSSKTGYILDMQFLEGKEINESSTDYKRMFEEIEYYSADQIGEDVPAVSYSTLGNYDQYLCCTKQHSGSTYEFVIEEIYNEYYGDTYYDYNVWMFAYRKISDPNEIFTVYFACTSITVNGNSFSMK